MGHKDIGLDNLFSYILENAVRILNEKTELSDPLFTSYEIVPVIRNGKTEINIDTGSGLISIIETDGPSNRCVIYPNSLNTADTLTARCDELFQKVSDTDRIGREQNIRVKSKKYTGYAVFLALKLQNSKAPQYPYHGATTKFQFYMENPNKKETCGKYTI